MWCRSFSGWRACRKQCRASWSCSVAPESLNSLSGRGASGQGLRLPSLPLVGGGAGLACVWWLGQIGAVQTVARVRWLACPACSGRLGRDPAAFGVLGLPVLVPRDGPSSASATRWAFQC